MIHQRELRRAVKHGEREVLSQFRPRNILRDARDLALKFQRDEAVRDYVAPRIWAALPVVLVFVLVSTVCSIDTMFGVARLTSEPSMFTRILALLCGAGVWLGGAIAQAYVFVIWLEGRAAQRSRTERGIRADVPTGVLAYLKYSRALPAWVFIFLCVVLPIAIMAPRAPLVSLLLIVMSLLAPFLFKKFDS